MAAGQHRFGFIASAKRPAQADISRQRGTVQLERCILLGQHLLFSRQLGTQIDDTGIRTGSG